MKETANDNNHKCCLQTPGTFDTVYFAMLNMTDILDLDNTAGGPSDFAFFDSQQLGTRLTGVDVCLAKEIPAQYVAIFKH